MPSSSKTNNFYKYSFFIAILALIILNLIIFVHGPAGIYVYTIIAITLCIGSFYRIYSIIYNYLFPNKSPIKNITTDNLDFKYILGITILAYILILVGSIIENAKATIAIASIYLFIYLFLLFANFWEINQKTFLMI